MSEEEVGFCTAIAADLNALAALHDRELDQGLLDSVRANGFPGSLNLDIASSEGLAAELAALPETLPIDLADQLAAQYADVYLINGCACSPTESPWVDPDGLERQQPMLTVRAWYRRHHLVTQDKRPDDHVVHELGFLAWLLESGKTDEAAGFLHTHLLAWLPRFAETLARRHGPPLYVALAILTAEYLSRLGEALPPTAR